MTVVEVKLDRLFWERDITVGDIQNDPTLNLIYDNGGALLQVTFGVFDMALGTAIIGGSYGAGVLPGIALYAVGVDQIVSGIGKMFDVNGPLVLEYLGSQAALQAGFGNDTSNLIGSLTPGVLWLGFGAWGSAGRGAIGSEVGRIAGWGPRAVDYVSELTVGERLIGNSLHKIFDGTRFEGAMQRTADWLRLKACFAAGTKLLAKGAWGQGWREIERITTDDLVASRDENNPGGAVEWKAVEELFQRTASVITLTVNGREIRTTSEHPFYHAEKGWLPAGDLVTGDRLVGQFGEVVIVTKAESGGEYESVYNLRVADWHTYFVGDDGWGFGVWAHNANYAIKEALENRVINRISRQRAGILTAAELNPQHHIFPQAQRTWFSRLA